MSFASDVFFWRDKMNSITNEYILKVAMEQSAKDIGCKMEDLLTNENRVVPFQLGEKAKKYYELPIIANFISYGNNVVAAGSDDVLDILKEYVEKFEFYHCFETPNSHWLEERITPMGYKVCFMAEYYLPDVRKLQESIKKLEERPFDFELRILEQPDFKDLYLPEWSNALCEKRKELDVLGVGAYEGNKLVGFAACSADAEEMWQIGIDVLPEYRRRGIASTLTVKLAWEIMKRGKVPFYCTAWSNIRSVRNAFKSGFIPAWAEMTVKPIEVINQVNNEA